MGIDEQEREQAILDAATRLLLRHGYNKTTMSDVAEAVNLNRALIYLHFKSKDEVVEALILRGFHSGCINSSHPGNTLFPQKRSW